MSSDNLIRKTLWNTSCLADKKGPYGKEYLIVRAVFAKDKADAIRQTREMLEQWDFAAPKGGIRAAEVVIPTEGDGSVQEVRLSSINLMRERNIIGFSEAPKEGDSQNEHA